VNTMSTIEDKDSESLSWTCEKCSFKNPNMKYLACEICLTSRKHHGDDDDDDSDMRTSSDEDAGRTSLGVKTPKPATKRLKSGKVDEAAFAAAFNAKYQEYCEDMSFNTPIGGTSSSIRDLLSSSRKEGSSKEEEDEDEEDEEEVEKQIEDMSAAHEYFSKSRNVSKSIKCFNCGMKGHMKIDCPKKKMMKCALCATAGHETFTCPDRRCILCTKRGHLASECKERGRLQLLHCKTCGPNVCHITVSCPKAVSSRKHLHSKLICIICGKLGHLRCDKITKKNQNTKYSMSCYNCGSQFHDASNCKLPREASLLRSHRAKQSASVAASIRSGSFRGGGGGECWNCNGVGHISRDCPNRKRAPPMRGGRGRGGRNFRGFRGRGGGGRGGRGGVGSRRIQLLGNKRKR